MKTFKVYERVYLLAGFGYQDEFLGYVEARDAMSARNKGQRKFRGVDRGGVPARRRVKENFYVKEAW